MGMESLHQNCLICKSTNIKSLKHYKKSLLVKCRDCGFVFSSKIPAHNELIIHYENYGRDDYLSPLTVKRYHDILDEFEIYRKNNNLLDIGCGIGYFLEEAKKRGWNTYGTEFTERAIEICKGKGIQMYSGVLNPDNYQDTTFDVITSFEVLEHINNPSEEISSIRKILRKGGLFFFTTPNFNSLLRYFLKENWNVIAYPEHLSYYTPKTIKRLLKNNSFKKKKLQTTGISVTRLRNSFIDGNRPNISSTTTDEKLRKSFESNYFMRSIKYLLNAVLNIMAVGDTLKGYFVKEQD